MKIKTTIPILFISLLPCSIMAQVNRTTPSHTSNRDKAKPSTDKINYSNIVARERKINGKSLLKLALTYHSTLGLSTIQLASLRKADVLNDYFDKVPKQFNPDHFDNKKFMYSSLSSILNDEQFTKLLIYVNQPKALRSALGDWNELKRMSIGKELDSATVVNNIRLWKVNKMLLIEKNYCKPANESKALLYQLNKVMPVELISLNKARSTKNKPKQQGDKPAFIW
jgi:hypothetical protein